MALRISLTIEGEVALDRTLARIIDNVEDASPVWEVLANRFAKAELRQFRSEGAYGSGGWTPLSADYARWKARHYPGKKILERTGELKRSLTVRPFGVEVIETQFMVVGSGISYGRFHQLGSEDGRPPQRRPVELPESERRQWVNLIQRFVITGETGR